MNRINMLPLAALVAGAMAVFAHPASAGDFKQQTATAAAHAGMAAAATEPGMAKGHMQHVINCLVGPAGDGFDPAQANPCKDQGFGALPDAPMDKVPALQAALKMAREAFAEPDPAKARDKAAAAQTSLGKIAM
jgi:hypothetical protein